MDRLQEIIDRLKAIDARQEAIENDVKDNHKGSFTDDLRAEYDLLQEEFETLKAEKDQLEADQQRLNNRADRDSSTFAANTRRTSPNAGTPFPQADQGTRIHATPRQVSSLRNFHGERNGLRAEERALNFGYWALASLEAQMPGRFNFGNRIPQDVRAALHQSNDATGFGHFIPHRS